MPGTLLALIAFAVGVHTGIHAERTIAGTTVHAFSLPVPAGWFVAGVVDQRERDLLLIVRDPQAREIARFDAWDRGSEIVAFAAQAGGVYVIEVQTVDRKPGASAYAIRVDPPREYAPDDDRRAAAAVLSAEGKQLFAKRDATSLRASIGRRRETLEIWRALGDRPAQLATLSAIGDAFYRLSEFADAEASYRQALVISEEIADRRSSAEVLNNLGILHWNKGAVVDARQFFGEALHLWEALRFDYGRAATLTNLAILAWESGELADARRDNARALALFKTLRDRRGEAYVLGNAAIVADTLGRRQEAIRDLARAVRLFGETGDRIAQGRALVRLARIQLAVGSRTAAIASVARSLPLIRESSERLAEADALETLARARAQFNRPAARRAYSRALELYDAVGSRRGRSGVLHGLGTLALADGDARQALEYLARARDLRREIELRSLEADTLFHMIAAARTAGDLEKARTYAEDALTVVELVRANVFERELRMSYTAAVQRFYGSYIEVLLELHDQQPDRGFAARAFEAAARAKARGFVESLREVWAGPPSTADQTLVARARRLRLEIAHASHAVWLASEKLASPEADRRLRERLSRLLSELEGVEAEIRRLEPKYAATLLPPSVRAVDVQRVLDDRAVLLEYFFTNRRSFVWVVTRNSITVAELGARRQIESAARHFLALASAAASRSDDPAFRSTSALLTRLLLAPIASWLDRPRVVLSPDGALRRLPWRILEAPGSRAALFGDAHDLLTVFSSTSFVLVREELAARPPAPKLLALIADPVLAVSDPRVTPASERLSASAPPRRLSRLPFSRREAAAIAALAPPGADPLIALDFDASRQLLTGPQLRRYQYIQISSHARNERPAALSAVVLTLVSKDGEQVDGFVRLQEIVRLDLNAELVVLSACSTAVGAPGQWDGISSLGQAFVTAGARRVIMSQWDVDDAATAFMMERFYRHLFSTPARSVTAALKAAQLDMRHSRRFSPLAFWAGWTLTGADW